MSLPIFWRLFFSHLGILLLSGAACLYSIVQLGSLSGTARSAIDNNHRLIDYQEALTDAFLSQIRYGGKYLITHVEARHEQMLQFENDFNKYLELLKSLGHSEKITTAVTKIERLHRQYHELFDREVEYIRTKQNYAQSRFQQERDKIIESAVNELDDLQAHLRAKLQEKLESIEHGARTSKGIAILTTVVVSIFGALLSFKVSKEFAGPPQSPTEVAQLRAFTNIALPFLHGSKNSLSYRLKRLSWLTLTFVTAWKRKNPGTRKGV